MKSKMKKIAKSTNLFRELFFVSSQISRFFIFFFLFVCLILEYVFCFFFFFFFFFFFLINGWNFKTKLVQK